MTQPNPYEAPQSPQGPAPLHPLPDVPFYRRNNTASTLLFVALAVGFGGPMLLAGLLGAMGLVGSTLVSLLLGAPLLAVCVIVLAGDVWYDTFDAQGQRNKWGFANKVVAGIIIAGWVYSIVARFIDQREEMNRKRRKGLRKDAEIIGLKLDAFARSGASRCNSEPALTQ